MITLNEYTRRILARIAKYDDNDFSAITAPMSIALHDITNGSPCSIRAINISSPTIPRAGDILIGFYALEPVEFTMEVNVVLPDLVRLRYELTEPPAFCPMKHKMGKNQFVFAYTRDGCDYVVNKIGMQYNNLCLTNIRGSLNPTLNFLCIYGYLQTEERLRILASGSALFYVCPSLRNRMATVIQKHWRECISNPLYTMCRARLKREATECMI